MSKKNENYTEDWLPVKQILNGMIQLDNGLYVSGVKVEPKNIFIMDGGLQNQIINSLRNFYDSIDYEFWLIIADRPVDIHVYLSQLQLLYKESVSPVARKIIMQDINKANDFMGMQYNVVDTEFYIIFQEKRLELVQKKLQNLVSGLANCRLSATQVSNADLRLILDNFLNSGSQSNFGTVVPK